MSQSAITVDQVTVTYRNGHTALRDATFQVPGGSIAALVGVNGSGKSTLFKALMGFVHLAQGDITILQQSVNKALKKNLIAYVPQSEEVDWSFPVLVEDVVMMDATAIWAGYAVPLRMITPVLTPRWRGWICRNIVTGRLASCPAGRKNVCFLPGPSLRMDK